MRQWAEVVAACEEDDRGKQDTAVPISKLTYHNHERMDIDGQPFRFTEDGFKQFCAKIGVPSDYLPRCSTPNQQQQVAEQLQRLGKDHMFLLRLKNDRIRASLSTSYAIINNTDLVKAIDPVIRARNMEVERFHIDDGSFHLRLLDRKMARVLDDKDEHVMGVHLVNSEIGYSRIVAYWLLWKQICTNGMMGIGESEMFVNRRHYGAEIPQIVRNGLDKMLASIDTRSSIFDRMNGLRQIKVEDPKKRVFRFVRDVREHDRLAEAWLLELMKEPGANSAFDLVQALTRYARIFSPVQRIYYERLAGQFAQEYQLEPSVN